MTSLAKKIPVAVGVLLFGIAALVATVRGAELPTALLRGFIAGGIGILFAWFPAYLIFSDPLPQAKAPQGLERLDEKFKAAGAPPEPAAPAAKK